MTAGTPPEKPLSPTVTSVDVTRRFAPGTLVAGRYRIVSVAGVGGMGVVYRARDEELGVDAALKVLRPDLGSDPGVLERFRSELRLAREVTHKNVVRIHDIGEHEGLRFLTMRYVEGRSLSEVLEREGPMPPERAVSIVRQVASALEEAHRAGVIHRDLKPGNILLDAEDSAFITDFGVARSLASDGLTRAGAVVGTPDYLSPEQIAGDPVDGRTDLYALGIVFYEMLTGQLPFRAGSQAEMLGQRLAGRARDLSESGIHAPAWLRAVVRRLLERSPPRRYPDAAALVADLDRARAAPIRRPGVRAGVAAAVVVLAAVAAWVALRQRRRRAPGVRAAFRRRGDPPPRSRPLAARSRCSRFRTRPPILRSRGRAPEFRRCSRQISPRRGTCESWTRSASSGTCATCDLPPVSTTRRRSRSSPTCGAWGSSSPALCAARESDCASICGWSARARRVSPAATCPPRRTDPRGFSPRSARSPVGFAESSASRRGRPRRSPPPKRSRSRPPASTRSDASVCSRETTWAPLPLSKRRSRRIPPSRRRSRDSRRPTRVSAARRRRSRPSTGRSRRSDRARAGLPTACARARRSSRVNPRRRRSTSRSSFAGTRSTRSRDSTSRRPRRRRGTTPKRSRRSGRRSSSTPATRGRGSSSGRTPSWRGTRPAPRATTSCARSPSTPDSETRRGRPTS